MADERPVLAVDVDGVVSLFGFDEPLTEAPGEIHLIDGVAHVISRPAGERLVRLAQHFDLIWATGWEERANEHLPLLLGLGLLAVEHHLVDDLLDEARAVDGVRLDGPDLGGGAAGHYFFFTPYCERAFLRSLTPEASSVPRTTL